MENSLEKIVSSASEWADMDLHDLPTLITSPFGQSLQIIDGSGDLQAKLTIEKVGCRPSVLYRWDVPFHANPYVEWIARAWALDHLRANLQVRTVQVLMKNLIGLKSGSRDPERIAQDIFRWAKRLTNKGTQAEITEAITSARSMYGWALEEGLPGFDEFSAYELFELTPSKRSKETLVSMRDVVEGPFTRMELQMIETAISQNDKVSLRQKAAFLLARDWGLRPVQMALLATEDLGEDELGPYVRVCSVKGKIRSRLRRTPSNQVKRYIADDTLESIKALSVESTALGESIRLRVKARIGSHADNLPTPLFPSLRRTEARIERMCRDTNLVAYVLFDDAWAVGSSLRSLTEDLSLINPRLGLLGNGDNLLKVSALRLRRTKGTSMVLAGASIEDVAEALDHVDTGSVAHYFRYNTDVHELINQACARSPDFVEAVKLWEGRIGSESDRVKDAIISGLGTCKLGRPCPHHPTVSCYACQMFKPWREANHKKSLRDIEAFQATIGENATGPLARQLDAAVFGAKALIAAMGADLK